MKTFISIGLSVVVSLMFTACGSQDKTPLAAPGTACPAGSTLQNNVCVGPNGSVVSPNSGSTGARFYSENWSARNLNIAPAGINAFVQNAMGVCGPFTQEPDCSRWVSGALDIVLMTDNVQSNQLTAVFRMKPFGTGWVFPPRVVPLNFTVSVTNNNQGFEARAYGDPNSPANRSLIQIQVATGKFEDSYFDYRIAYRGEIIITGRFQKCGTADCGLSSNIGN